MTTGIFILAQNANERRWQSMRDSFSRPSDATNDSLMTLAIVAIGFAVLLLLLVINRSRKERTGRFTRNPSRRLFMSCLKELGVSPADRFIMRLAARRSQLSQPAVMLLSPALLEQHAGAWADGLSIEGLRFWVRQRIAHVSTQLFPAPDSPVASD